VALAHKKFAWSDYEVMLTTEKKVSRKLLNMVATSNAKERIEVGQTNTYRDYLKKNSNFGLGSGSFFPKRHHSIHHIIKKPD
jgi:hypothetical protein